MAEQPGGGAKQQPAAPAQRRKTQRQVLEDNAPWLPTPYSVADAMAIKALYDGKATEEQQKRALAWVIEKASACHNAHYYAGQDGERNTVFALGKAQVGQEIIKLIKIPKAKLKQRRAGDENEVVVS